MGKIRWGIIGCGDVTEIKSGPAFNKITDSSLVAVMSRNELKAADYARRHNVSRYYINAVELINDPDVNAVYVATPPDSHAKYAIMALNAGKPVYVEKPMALNYNECQMMIKASENTGVPLYVAYYRRSLPSYIKIKELIESGTIGNVRTVNINLYRPVSKSIFNGKQQAWRFNPDVSGGGLFVDLGSHQLDFLDYIFGRITSVNGFACNHAGLYPAEDAVCAYFVFESGVIGTGLWCFSASEKCNTDRIEIIGNKGKITFSTFDFTPIILEAESTNKKFDYPKPKHVEEYLIETIVGELLGHGKCPSTGISAARTSKVMDKIIQDYYT